MHVSMIDLVVTLLNSNATLILSRESKQMPVPLRTKNRQAFGEGIS